MPEEPREIPLDELADDHDEDGWDIQQHGRMRDFATDDGVVEGIDYDPDDDDAELPARIEA